MSHPHPKARRWQRHLTRTIICAVALILLIGLGYARAFGPTDQSGAPEEFVVNPGETLSQVAGELQYEGYVRSYWALRIAFVTSLPNDGIRPGGYTISKGMDTLTIAETLGHPPYLVFVTLPQGVRKEQIGDILAAALYWTDAQKQDWLNVATAPQGDDFVEGVYYPDTYLIPSDQSPEQIAARLRGRFTDETAQYAKEAQEEGLSWPDVLTLASIVEREAAKNDKPLVAGILWNRVHDDMKLQADATLQYAKGTEGNWWPVPLSQDKYIDSAFNTYENVGLPPHPIAEPGLDSIAAVIHPQATDCIYYLHDTDHVIHCSANYAGQQANVAKYLK